MKKVLIFLGLLLLCLFVGSVSAMSGSGTVSDPYILTTSADLTALSGTGLAGYGVNAYYELGADIDMSSVSDFTPIGTSSYRLAGSFDGKNHTISNLNCVSYTGYVGLFSYVQEGSYISNLYMYNCTIVDTSANGRVGVLFGSYSGPGAKYIQNINIINCYVSGLKLCGGLCGSLGAGNADNINICNCLITSSNSVAGGISGVLYPTGQVNSCTITNCDVENCYINSTGNNAGGVIGYDGSSTTATYNSSITGTTIKGNTIVGSSYISGIYGLKRSSDDSVLDVTDCTVSDCSIIGTSNVAGVGN